MTAHSDPSDGSRSLGTLADQLTPALASLESVYRLPSGDGADALQEALILFALSANRVRRPDKWLYRVVRNRCARLARDRQLRARPLEEASTEHLWCYSPADPAHSQRLRLDSVLLRLSSRSQTVLRMRFLEGMSWREISSVLGCGIEGAKKAVYRSVLEARETATKLERVSKTSTS